MKIIIEDIGPDEEEAVIIRCREVDEAVMQKDALREQIFFGYRSRLF